MSDGAQDRSLGHGQAFSEAQQGGAGSLPPPEPASSTSKAPYLLMGLNGKTDKELAQILATLVPWEVQEERALTYGEGIEFLKRAASGQAQAVAFKEFEYKGKVEREFWFRDLAGATEETKYVVVHVHYSDDYDWGKYRRLERQTVTGISQLNVRHFKTKPDGLISAKYPTLMEGAYTENRGQALLTVAGSEGWKWAKERRNDKVGRLIQKVLPRETLNSALERDSQEGIDEMLSKLNISNMSEQRLDDLILWYPKREGGADPLPRDRCVTDMKEAEWCETTKKLMEVCEGLVQDGIKVDVDEIAKLMEPSEVGVEVLLVGNNEYNIRDVPNKGLLHNCRRDTEAVAERLREFGARCSIKIDVADEREFSEELEHWVQVLTTMYEPGGLRIAIFYYAGHGLFVNGELHLVPTFGSGRGGKMGSLRPSKDLFPVLDVAREIRKHDVLENCSILLILDCCREELRAGGNLSSVNSLGGAFKNMHGVETWFSALYGSTAKDGEAHSPFALALLRHLMVDKTISQLKSDLTADSELKELGQTFNLAGFLFHEKETISGRAKAEPEQVVSASSSAGQLKVIKAPRSYAHLILHPQPVLVGRYKFRVELANCAERIKERLEKYAEKLLAQDRAVVISDGETSDVFTDVRNRRPQILIWSSVGRGWTTCEGSNPINFDTLVDLFKFDQKPSIVVVCHSYGACTTAEGIFKNAGVAVVLWFKRDLLSPGGDDLLVEVVMPVCCLISQGAKNEVIKLELLAKAAEYFRGRHEECWGIFWRKGSECSAPSWGLTFGATSTCADTKIENDVSKKILFPAKKPFADFVKQCREQLDCLLGCDLELVSRLIGIVDKQMRLGGRENRQHVITCSGGGSLRCRAIAKEVCMSFFYMSKCDLVLRVSEGSDMDALEREVQASESEWRALVWIDVVACAEKEPLAAHVGERLLKLCAGRHRLVMLLTNCGGDTDASAEQISGAGGFELFEIDDVQVSRVEANFMHNEIKLCIVDAKGERLDPLQVTQDDKFALTMREVLTFSNGQGLNARPNRQLPIAAWYVDDDKSILVRVCFSDVHFLHKLRDDALMGTLKERIEKHKAMRGALKGLGTIEVDCSDFAEKYQQFLLEADKLTLHQQENLGECLSHPGSFHVRAPAGAGKTFVALHLILELLLSNSSKGSQILFVAKHDPLVLLMSKWLCVRLQARLRSVLLVKKALCRFHVLYVPFENGPRAVTLQQQRLSCTPLNATQQADRYDLIVVDEAHQIYSQQALWSSLQRYSDGARQLALFSDISQSHGLEILYPEPPGGMIQVLMTEVIRNSKRIVTGAMAFQLEELGADSGAKSVAGLGGTQRDHDAMGPPLVSRLFDVEGGDKFEFYARKVIEAVREDVIGKFKTLELHDRLAIIVPDIEFRDRLKQALKQPLAKLADNLNRTFKIVDAREASCVLSGSREPSLRVSEGECLVLDTINHFDGLERLIVLAVGLDEANSAGQGALHSALETRCRLYRAITRAHMLVCVVNEYLNGGWLEWLANVKLVKGLDMEWEQGRMDLKAAEKATSDIRSESGKILQSKRRKVEVQIMSPSQEGDSEHEKKRKNSSSSFSSAGKQKRPTKKPTRTLVWDSSRNAVANVREDPVYSPFKKDVDDNKDGLLPIQGDKVYTMETASGLYRGLGGRLPSKLKDQLKPLKAEDTMQAQGNREQVWSPWRDFPLDPAPLQHRPDVCLLKGRDNADQSEWWVRLEPEDGGAAIQPPMHARNHILGRNSNCPGCKEYLHVSRQ